MDFELPGEDHPQRKPIRAWFEAHRHESSVRKRERDHDTCRHPRNEYAGRSADRCKDDPFSQRLPHEPERRGAERGLNGNLCPVGSGKKEIREIRRGNEQHQTRHDEQDRQRLLVRESKH